jgi:hypothetical protein
MEIDPSWTPQLSASTLFTERCYLVGLFFVGLAYGAVVTLSILSLRLLWKRITGSNRHRKLGWIGVVVYLLVAGTVYPASIVALTVLSFSTYRNISGGPGKQQVFLCRPNAN